MKYCCFVYDVINYLFYCEKCREEKTHCVLLQLYTCCRCRWPEETKALFVLKSCAVHYACLLNSCCYARTRGSPPESSFQNWGASKIIRCRKCEVVRYFPPVILYVVSEPACDGGLLAVTVSCGKAVHDTNL